MGMVSTFGNPDWQIKLLPWVTIEEPIRQT